MHVCNAGTVETLQAGGMLMCVGLSALISVRFDLLWVNFWHYSLTPLPIRSLHLQWHALKCEVPTVVKRTLSKAPAAHSLHEELQILPVHPTTCWTVTGTSSIHLGPLWHERTGADLGAKRHKNKSRQYNTRKRDEFMDLAFKYDAQCIICATLLGQQ